MTVKLTGAENELLDQAVRNAGPIYDSDGIRPVVEGIISARIFDVAMSSVERTERLRVVRGQVASSPQAVRIFDAYLLGFLSASVPDEAWDRGLEAARTYLEQAAS